MSRFDERMANSQYADAIKALRHHLAGYPQRTDADAATIEIHTRLIVSVFECIWPDGFHADAVWGDVRRMERAERVVT